MSEHQNPYEQNEQVEQQLTSQELIAMRDQEVAAVMYARNAAVGDLYGAYGDVLPHTSLREGRALLDDMNTSVYSTLHETPSTVSHMVTNTANALHATLSEHDRGIVDQLYPQVRKDGMRGDVPRMLFKGVEDKQAVHAILDHATMQRHMKLAREIGPDSPEAHEALGELSTITMAHASNALADVTRFRRANRFAEEYGARNPRVAEEIAHGTSPIIRRAMQSGMDKWIRHDAVKERVEGNHRADHFSVQGILDGASRRDARDLIAALVGDPKAPARPENPEGAGNADTIASPLEAATLRRTERRVAAEEHTNYQRQLRQETGVVPDHSNGGRPVKERFRLTKRRLLGTVALGTAVVTSIVTAGSHMGGGSPSAHAEHGKGRVAATASPAPHTVNKGTDYKKLAIAWEKDDPMRTDQPKSQLMKPLSTHGGWWNTAEHAVWDAGPNGDNNFAQDEGVISAIPDTHIRAIAQKALQTEEAAAIVSDAVYQVDGKQPEMSALTIPSIREETQTDLDYARADQAALAATQDDYGTARKLMGQITNPGIAKKVQQVIAQEQSGDYQSAINSWSTLDSTAQNRTVDISNAALSSWFDLERHTTAYDGEYKNARTK